MSKPGGPEVKGRLDALWERLADAIEREDSEAASDTFALIHWTWEMTTADRNRGWPMRPVQLSWVVEVREGTRKPWTLAWYHSLLSRAMPLAKDLARTGYPSRCRNTATGEIVVLRERFA